MATLNLNKTNRLKLAQAFRWHPRVDISIECAVEGQMGVVSVDDARIPTVFRLEQGPFWYFAGDAHSTAGQKLLGALPEYVLLMPAPGGWIEVAQEIFAGELHELERYSYDSSVLSATYLNELVSRSKYGAALQPFNVSLAAQCRAAPEHFVDLSAFDSAQDFIQRGLGYCLLLEGRMVAAAFSSLVCSRGIEVSIFVEERFRQRGIATALGARLALDCLERGWQPHWDAANRESCKLAEKLGYQRSGVYLAHYRAG